MFLSARKVVLLYLLKCHFAGKSFLTNETSFSFVYLDLLIIRSSFWLSGILQTSGWTVSCLLFLFQFFVKTV